MTPYPRLLLAAPNSSSGKTTVSIGLMAALRARALRVAPFKVGPDYIDPGYHTLATGLPGRNLDAWLCGTERIAPLFAHGASGADVSVVEGVMGLYDGRLGLTEGRSGFGSSAHIAELIDAPVVLVMDTSGVSRTLAATAYGLANHLQAPKVAGVILNKTGSPRAVDELRGALAEVGLPVLGAIPRSRDLVVPSRHLGLVPAAERDQAQAVIDAAAELVAAHVDLDEVLAVASAAAELDVTPWSAQAEISTVGGRPRIAVAAGRAFTFR
ncbi:MAG: cobyrinate a,c-diamide synthase, partial [Propionibacterium sp.]|nr:cobyrinate a,c-diamide synthase [Propionibacterium sp.]